VRSKWNNGWPYYRMSDNAEMWKKKRKVNGSILRVQIWYFNNHSAVPLTQYITERIWVNELR